jgi:hypothetical protein
LKINFSGEFGEVTLGKLLNSLRNIMVDYQEELMGPSLLIKPELSNINLENDEYRLNFVPEGKMKCDEVQNYINIPVSTLNRSMVTEKELIQMSNGMKSDDSSVKNLYKAGAKSLALGFSLPNEIADFSAFSKWVEKSVKFR